LEGYTIVTADSMIPLKLKIDADQRFFGEGLEAHPRASQ
jgi:hypothetical protein